MNQRTGQIYLGVALGALILISCQIFSPLTTPTPAIITTPTVYPQPLLTSLPDLPPLVDRVVLEDALVEIYDRINPGVVSLRGLTPEGDSLGSGFVFDHKGHIVTNYHVVEGVSEMEVAFPSGIKTRAEVIGTDLDSDLAVIKVNVSQEELFPLALGDSDLVQVGQTVIAIGNPFGFRGTMTLGIVSGLGRTMESLHDAPGGGTFSAGDIIQTDAAINPGNSGGPLLNLNGEVIGINRAIYTTSYTSSGDPINTGLGFAISVNILKRVVPDLITQGSYDYPYVGISSVNELSLIEQETLGLPQATGVYVNTITPGSPAERAGLIGGSRRTDLSYLFAGGDLITAIDGFPVLAFGDFISYLIKHKSPGDTVTLTVIRNGRELSIELVLDRRPASDE